MSIKLISHSISKTEEKVWPDLPLVKLVINSGEDILTGKKWSNRSVKPVLPCFKKDYAIQLYEWRKKYRTSVELPYSIDVGHDQFHDDENCIKAQALDIINRTKPKNTTVDAVDIEIGGKTDD